jgi:hypothetical protein
MWWWQRFVTDWLILGLTTQSELQRLYSGVRDKSMIINEFRVRTGKEAVVAYFNIQPRNLYQETEERSVRTAISWPRDSNLIQVRGVTSTPSRILVRHIVYVPGLLGIVTLSIVRCPRAAVAIRWSARKCWWSVEKFGHCLQFLCLLYCFIIFWFVFVSPTQDRWQFYLITLHQIHVPWTSIHKFISSKQQQISH